MEDSDTDPAHFFIITTKTNAQFEFIPDKNLPLEDFVFNLPSWNLPYEVMIELIYVSVS